MNKKNVNTNARIKWLKHMTLFSVEVTIPPEVQMQMNLDSYLQRIETIGTLVFAEEEVYKYSAVDSDNDEYEAIKTEQLIADKLYDLCIMENFVDFSIVYSNNHSVGKMSNGTVKHLEIVFTATLKS